jgi:PhnB protein
MNVQPYLIFNGRCEEALSFYRKAIGAEVEMQMCYKESPEPCDSSMVPRNWDDKIMHAAVRIGDATIFAADGNSATPPTFEGITLTLTVKNEAEADRAFNALVDGGKVTMPLMQTFYSPRFGMLVDRFGVSWMIYVPGQKD